MTDARRSPAVGLYVVDDCCTQCGVPTREAPELFEMTATGCAVRRQPASPADVRTMLAAIHSQELYCIRYRGLDAKIISAILAQGDAGKLDFVGQLARAATAFCHQRPRVFSVFTVFERSCEAFLAVAGSHGLLESEIDPRGIAALSAAFRSDTSSHARFAEVFLGLIVCRAFSAQPWHQLLEADVRNMGLAAQACLYILLVSGSDAADELRLLVDGRADRRESLAEAHSTLVYADSAASAWLQKILD